MLFRQRGEIFVFLGVVGLHLGHRRVEYSLTAGGHVMIGLMEYECQCRLRN